MQQSICVCQTGQTIGSLVDNATTSSAIIGASVYLFDSSVAQVGEDTTDALGKFVSSGELPAGTYYAAAANGTTSGVSSNYINSLYSDSNCLLGYTVTGGTATTAASTPVTGVNFNLLQGIGFAGTVLDSNANPLSLVAITVVDASGKVAGKFSTNSLGKYLSNGLPAGTYFARTSNVLGLQDQLYGGTDCTGNCNILLGTPIVFSAPSQPQNISFSLTLPSNWFANSFE
jgi:hypothetical protein